MKVLVMEPFDDKCYYSTKIPTLKQSIKYLGYSLVEIKFKGDFDSLDAIAYIVKLLKKSDEVCFVEGWNDSDLCKIIYGICLKYGIKITSESDYKYWW